jgi:hypothetical protein
VQFAAPFAQAKPDSPAFRPARFFNTPTDLEQASQQRIAEDPNESTAYVRSLSLAIVTSVVSLVPFLVIVPDLGDRVSQPRREGNCSAHPRASSRISRALGTSPPVFRGVHRAGAFVSSITRSNLMNQSMFDKALISEIGFWRNGHNLSTVVLA